VRARLDAFFPARARLELSPQAPRGLRVEITIAQGHA
jgi:hypothetical protein